MSYPPVPPDPNSPENYYQQQTPQAYVAQVQQPMQPAAKNRIPLYLSSGALFIALISLVITLIIKSKVGSSSDSYDLSTSDAALQSYVKMIHKRDLAAVIDVSMDMFYMESGIGDPNEFVQSLEVVKKKAWGDKELLFISFNLKGERVNTVAAFTKNLKTKNWQFTDFSRYQLGENDEKLRAEIEAWEDNK